MVLFFPLLFFLFFFFNLLCCQEEVTNLGKHVQHLARTVKPQILAFTEISSKYLHLLRTIYVHC